MRALRKTNGRSTVSQALVKLCEEKIEGTEGKEEGDQKEMKIYCIFFQSDK